MGDFAKPNFSCRRTLAALGRATPPITVCIGSWRSSSSNASDRAACPIRCPRWSGSQVHRAFDGKAIAPAVFPGGGVGIARHLPAGFNDQPGQSGGSHAGEAGCHLIRRAIGSSSKVMMVFKTIIIVDAGYGSRIGSWPGGRGGIERGMGGSFGDQRFSGSVLKSSTFFTASVDFHSRFQFLSFSVPQCISSQYLVISVAATKSAAISAKLANSMAGRFCWRELSSRRSRA